MNIFATWRLGEGYEIVSVDEFPPDLLQDQAKKYFATDYPMMPKNHGLDEMGVQRLRALKKNLSQQFALKLAVLHRGKIVGWTDGWQDSIEQDTFFMGASLILPEHRRKGLYSLLVKKVIELTREKGFRSISSLHIMTNNPVIIGKLKMDFHIYGFEVNTRYGALVRLVFHHDDVKRSALRFRAGAISEKTWLNRGP